MNNEDCQCRERHEEELRCYEEAVKKWARETHALSGQQFVEGPIFPVRPAFQQACALRCQSVVM
jgi:hypothetical protein